jgi:hypothetical protein
MLILIAASFKGTVVPGCDCGARTARRWPVMMIRPQAAADRRGAGSACAFFYGPFPYGQRCYVARTRCASVMWRKGK